MWDHFLLAFIRWIFCVPAAVVSTPCVCGRGMSWRWRCNGHGAGADGNGANPLGSRELPDGRKDLPPVSRVLLRARSKSLVFQIIDGEMAF